MGDTQKFPLICFLLFVYRMMEGTKMARCDLVDGTSCNDNSLCFWQNPNCEHRKEEEVKRGVCTICQQSDLPVEALNRSWVAVQALQLGYNDVADFLADYGEQEAYVMSTHGANGARCKGGRTTPQTVYEK
jgi:hypothetical protein